MVRAETQELARQTRLENNMFTGIDYWLATEYKRVMCNQQASKCDAPDMSLSNLQLFELHVSDILENRN